MSSFSATPLAPKPATFEFVVGQRPDQLNAGSNKKLRSHLSKRGWEAYLEQKNKASAPVSVLVDEAAQRADDGARRKKRRRHRQAITWDVVEPDDPRFPGTGNVREAMLALVNSGRRMPLEKTLSIDYRLGGGRVDPFKSYPTPFRSYIPPLVDHYIVHMAVDIPELDQPGNAGLLRSRWFRMATTEISTFQVVLLLAAGNFVSVKGAVPAEQGFNLHQLKGDAIKSLKYAMDDEAKATSDSIIGAVAKMASFESMHGTEADFRLHMEHTIRLVNMRGGLNNLGLGGLLRRMLIWIDVNGNFLYKKPRYWPGENFDGSKDSISEPNPERFIAI
ncbi:uncharacterized protein TrAFT101_004313 [Trichoderma asperellum]|uniref:Uncharacterized protein n=2 Tax=Trichoderma asperellum TaxID=101201 RepID=A0A2T3ZN48_TRIA4|nr:hypothetical protein M441DRAFT_181317 [Trichoderma asperellum CBS 433.97]PTB46220.1 hypothetical protein M441DRAFT_181317 [Trichoderma asperellum CBS 433.97]UKZ88561.1 hypothetical protein TrAFT101_004313 [Trichoderma asperellum]